MTAPDTSIAQPEQGTGGERPAPSSELERAVARMARRRRRRVWRRAGLRAAQLAVVVLAVFAWSLISRSSSNQLILSSPSDVGRTLKEWSTSSARWDDVRITVVEALVGYLVGAAAGVVLAFIVASNRFVRGLLGPFLVAFNALPKVALAPLFIVWFGIGQESKVYFVVAGIMFISFSNVSTGLTAIDRTYLDNARVLGASRWWILSDVVLPTTVGWLMLSLRLSVSWALLSAVLAEYLGALGGQGKVIADGAANLDQSIVVAGILVTALMAVIADRLLALVERRFERWRTR